MGQFSKANVGLDFNDAIKKLCGTFRTYRILNTIAKFNVKLYAIINSRKNNVKHGLNYLLYLFMISGGFLKSPHILSYTYSQKQINRTLRLHKFE